MTTISALQSPSRVQRTWDLNRAAPARGVLSRLHVRSLSAPGGRVEVEASADMTVGMLKQRIAHMLNIPPRKDQQLQWWGLTLEDSRTLAECNISDGGELQLCLRSRMQAELEGLKDVRQVRVRSDDAVALKSGLCEAGRAFATPTSNVRISNVVARTRDACFVSINSASGRISHFIL